MISIFKDKALPKRYLIPPILTWKILLKTRGAIKRYDAQLQVFSDFNLRGMSNIVLDRCPEHSYLH